jgi:hypothetical protein
MEYVKGLFGKKEEPQSNLFSQEQPQTSFFGQPQQPGIMDRLKSMNPFAKGGKKKKPTKKPKKPKTKTKKNRK